MEAVEEKEKRRARELGYKVERGRAEPTIGVRDVGDTKQMTEKE